MLSFYLKRLSVTFICKEGDLINNVIKDAIDTGEGQTLKLTAEGFNEEFEIVSKFEYTWSVKIK